MMATKDFDLIVFGATSFVGQLLCKYLTEQFPNANSLTWAMAGRSKAKLETVRQSLGAAASSIPLLVADAFDGAALDALAIRTHAVVSTVGPYALYGEPMLQACVQAGADYCDLTGEVQWIKRMIDRYEAGAKSSGARIVPSCGFDSIPSDMGVHFLQENARNRFGHYCTHIKMRVKAAKGGVSGGTVASMMNVALEAAKDGKLRKALANPYLITPEGDRPVTRQSSLTKPQYDPDFHAWLAPFVMAAINTRIVHRSHALLGYPYGRDFRYDEAMMMGRGSSARVKASVVAGGLVAFAGASVVRPTRWLLNRFVLPAPGQGPSPEAQVKGFFDLRFFGQTADGQTLRAKVTGQGDPGYGSTSKMLGQAAAMLAKMPKEEKAGGFWTPATIFGDPLIAALEAHSGLSFQIVDETTRGSPPA